MDAPFRRRTYDAIVIGVGSSGAAVARALAKRGAHVLALERHALTDAGARWVNGVAGWQLEAAGIDRPKGEEDRGHGHAFHLAAGFEARKRVVVRGADLHQVDMRHLVARLQREAEGAGAELVGRCAVHRASAHEVDTTYGTVRADVIVDAAGVAAGPGHRGDGSTNSRETLCAAAMDVRRVVDPAGARAFLERFSLQERETISFAAVAGGYSIVNVTIEGDEVSLLTGSIPARGHPSGRALLDDFARRERWIGERVFGGARVIPLGIPPLRLHRDGVALLGDAAGQVFTAHGSGVGPGLVAANILAEEMAAGRGVEGYSNTWWRHEGPRFVFYDGLRRASARLTPPWVSLAIARGLISERTVRAALEQRWPSLL